MAKIKLSDNSMAMFMVCEAVGKDRQGFIDVKPDEDGLYDLTITLNGKELDVEAFLRSLHRSYNDAVRAQGASLLLSEYEDVLKEIHEIQAALQHHNKIFDDKVYSLE